MKSFVRFCPKCDKKKLLIRHGDRFLCWECSPQDEIAKLETGFIDFGDNLEITIKRIKTENHELLAYCPKFFKLLCNILIDKKADWHSQMLVNCALAYFVLPEDLVPEDKEGAEGYLDDLFLCSYVLIKINEIDKELLIRNWGFEEEIIEVIERVYNKTKEILRDKSEEILNLTGLKQYEALDPDERDVSNNPRLLKLAREKRELLGLLSFVVSKVYDKPRIRDLEKLKRFLETQSYYREIERIIAIAKEDRFYGEQRRG